MTTFVFSTRPEDKEEVERPFKALDESLAIRPLVCPKCRHHVGMYEPTVLYVGGIHIITPFIGYCNRCSARVRWRPLPQKEDEV